MNILVCGGAGYIGSHTVRLLQQQGHSPIIYDNLSKGYAQVAQLLQVPMIQGDISDKDRIKHILQSERIDAVMHFAAFIEVGESVSKPSQYYHNNVAKVLPLLDAMVEADVKTFIFSSTAATFGQPQTSSIDEQHSQMPINPYGRTKLMVEQILHDYDHAYGLKSAILRYFNAAGSDMTGLIGESHSPESHLIPLIIQAALGQRDSIKMYGDDYDTPDGSCIRDFVHVYDLAQAHLLAMQKVVSSRHSVQYNLGMGHGYSVKQVIERVKHITGQDFAVEIVQRRAGDPAVLVANSNKAKQELGWQPQYGLDDMIQSAYMWLQNKTY
jgi:UDP-glucose 4-epimerase